ncbi:MAG: hypothetical protein ACOX1I_04460 [Dethiobacteria bacterium]
MYNSMEKVLYCILYTGSRYQGLATYFMFIILDMVEIKVPRG